MTRARRGRRPSSQREDPHVQGESVREEDRAVREESLQQMIERAERQEPLCQEKRRG